MERPEDRSREGSVGAGRADDGGADTGSGRDERTMESSRVPDERRKEGGETDENKGPTRDKGHAYDARSESGHSDVRQISQSKGL